MADPIPIPRVNNNDDTVKVVNLAVAVGEEVHEGDLVFEVETEKAVVGIEAERDGYVLAVKCEVGDIVPVGTIAMWLGDTPDEKVPQEEKPVPEAAAETTDAGVTAKAVLLLRRHNLTADAVPRSGPRLTAADVEAYVAAAGEEPPVAAAPTTPNLPAAADLRPLTPPERGMVATVTWQRDHAVATYLEIEYDPRPWDAYAAEFARAGRQLLNPLLALISYRLVRLAREANANATILEDGGLTWASYQHVNLGFTVQSGKNLFLCVVDLADTMDEAAFVARLGELQRRAIANRLAPVEMRGATIGFTSMARWGIRRHIPVLAPHTALMVSHCAPSADGTQAVLGATYDHRLLSGFDIARLLQKLANPAKQPA